MDIVGLTIILSFRIFVRRKKELAFNREQGILLFEYHRTL